ncbi:MAG: TonB-dependent receptor [Rikenellaceae bacterium]
MKTNSTNKSITRKLRFALFTLCGVLLFSSISQPIYAQEGEKQVAKGANASLLRNVSGKIVDVADQPVVGATLQVAGTQTYTITNHDGEFSFPRVNADAKILIEYIGMKNIEIAASADLSSIVMYDDAVKMDEAVVIGYQTKIKANVTSSITQVNFSEMASQPTRDAISMLQGLTPGAQVTTATAQPGQSAALSIRGMSSVNSGGPYYVIDNIPGGDPWSLDPNNIESISIIKDAAGAAIYGANAASGVVVITTKSGSYNQPMKISYSGSYSFNSPTKTVDYTSTYDNAILANLSYLNAGYTTPYYSDEELGYLADPNIIAVANGTEWKFYADEDWVGLMYNTSVNQLHAVTINGGSETINYNVTGGYTKQEGFFNDYGPDSYDRYNLTATMQAKLLKDRNGKSLDKLILDVKGDYSRSTTARPGTYPSSIVYTMGTVPVYDPNGNYARAAYNSYNPIQLMAESGSCTTINNRVTMALGLTYNINEYFKLYGTGSYALNNSSYTGFAREFDYYGPDGVISTAAYGNKANSIDDYLNYQGTQAWRFMATYNRDFGKHKLNALFGNEGEYTDRKQVRVKRMNIVGNTLDSFLLGSTDGQTTSGAMYDESVAAFFSQISYNYDDRYLLEAVLRADASSRFAYENAWGYFPGVSAGWRAINEEFMKNQNVVSDLKIRASWGQVGNKSGIGRTEHITSYTYSSDYYPFAGENGSWIDPSNIPALDTTWETVTTKNIALDIAFLDNRLYFIAERFIKTNDDMIVGIEASDMIGGTLAEANYGSMETKGWEVSGGWKDRTKGGFQYGVNLSISQDQNMILNYGSSATQTPSLGQNLYLEGSPYRTYYGYETDGFYQNQAEVDAANGAVINAATGPGDIKYVDQNGDGVLNTEDLIELGSVLTPEYTFGIQLDAAYKGWDFGMTLSGELGAKAYLTGATTGLHYNSLTWSYEAHNDYWTENNPNATFPRPYYKATWNYTYSDFWMVDTSFIRLRNLSVGYTLPRELISKIGLSKFRIYANGQNLGVLTSSSPMMDIYDPESPGKNYPIAKSFSVGVNIEF